ncbi:hypothetical protein VSH64_43740 [Amycolatopsis rhabdoformis]|uniref:Type IV toxin-antitoxin system AbiEi family antitoxin domain-containing protein n=1 Tax=Amycolatopsis rhabdoformis TaxID=1448059 RepID=A0ABZ1I5G2_9PSEU|nr:hypothetical protein [Amycolatopsis rhabdoformis]WSE29638.1 hypothetical protein VSH64_43740 [Amycolatopsis rhabdoformis]
MTTTTSIHSVAFRDPASVGVIDLRTLRSAGVSTRRAARLAQPGGPWRRVYPGVFVAQNKPPTRLQLLHAAIARYGPSAVITGIDALRAHGVTHPLTGEIHLLLPHYRRPRAEAGVLTHRTARMPEPVLIDGLPYATAPRAALDLARRETDPVAVQRFTTLPLFWGLCDRAELQAELDAGNQRGSSAVRAVLRTLDDHETFTHGQALRILRDTPLPPPRWNVTICDLRGRRIGLADAWWDEVGLAWRYRTAAGPTDFSHLALTATGTVLVRCTPRQLDETRAEVSRELVRAYTQAARTPRPKVRALHRADTAA